MTAVDTEAAKRGLAPGLPLTDARARHPTLTVVEADEWADAQLLTAIADWCERFTPLVAFDPPDGLFLDVTGCSHLFAGEEAMLDAMCRFITARGFHVRAAIAGTSVAARALARGTDGAIVAPGEEAMAVSPLPVALLGADHAVVRGLLRAGLKTIGDVASRSPAEITARFGASFTAFLDRALGRRDTPISPRRPLPDYVVEKLFAEPVATEQVITATLVSLTEKLAVLMERNGKGARLIEAAFFRTDGAVRLIAVAAGQPTRDPDAIERLFREKLDALADPLDPGFGFDLIRLSARHLDRVCEQQSTFDTRQSESNDLNALVDRLSARFGARRIVRYLAQDTHIPERVALAVPAQQNASSSIAWPSRPRGEPPSRPVRLFERPEAIKVVAEVPDGPPARFQWRDVFHVVARAEGPERIAMEWWRYEGRALTRDYFRVEDDAGLRFWIYREGLYGRELRNQGESPCWFVHGLFA